MSKLNTVVNKLTSINEMVKVMEQLPQVEAPVKHHFSKGVYAREIFMPRDSIVIGKIHKTRHLNIISQGKCRVATPTRTFDVVAPYTFESFEGEQKVVFMLEDVVWTTIHLTNETDLDKIEQECIAKDYDEALINSLVEGLTCLGEW